MLTFFFSIRMQGTLKCPVASYHDRHFPSKNLFNIHEPWASISKVQESGKNNCVSRDKIEE